MALYFIGDLQGCDSAFAQLLAKIDFSPSRDTLYLLGDLVNRGPQSLQVLRRVIDYQSAARCLLGNHDLHLLGVAFGVRRPGRGDTLEAVLDAPDRERLVDWLRHQPLALHEHGWLMVHAGVLPQWTVEQTLALAAEIEAALSGNQTADFLTSMYGNAPARWDDSLQGSDRLRVAVNALTRLRFCTPDGEMEFGHHGQADAAPRGYLPWYDVPQRRTAADRIAFGHWSTQGLVDRPMLAGLDTGCVWGGALTALRFNPTKDERELISLDCEQASRPDS